MNAAGAEDCTADPQSQRPWGRSFFERCDIDPDNEADVRDAYESCRELHARWLWTGEGEIDGGTYYMLVDAIKDLYSWGHFPLDWPPPIIVRMSQPLKNTLARKPGG